MKRFLMKVVLFIALICIIMLGIVGFDRYIIGGQYKLGYQASLVDKIERLESINESKIILVGNSNLAFGIYSDQIEEAIGMPVVNLGLHGGLGNAYHEEIAKLNINEGDIVIVCHSNYEDEDVISDPELAWVTYDYNEKVWPIIRKKDYLTMLKAYPAYLRDSYFLWITRRGNLEPGNVYSRSAFNQYGDVIAKDDSEQMNTDELFKGNKISVPSINDTCINRLNNLNQYCKDRGATLLIAGYPIAYGEYSEYSEKDFNTFQSELASRLDCDVISDYSDYFFPYDYFYNTNMHLNEKGANARTKQLIEDIKNWLKE